MEKVPEPIRKKVLLLSNYRKTGLYSNWPWYHEKETVEIEVYYVGSRQNARPGIQN